MGRTASDRPVTDTGNGDEATVDDPQPAVSEPEQPAAAPEVPETAPAAGDLAGDERELVYVHHAGLDRYDRVPRGAAHSMIKTGWEIVPDPPIDDHGLPADLPVDIVVRLTHPDLTGPDGQPRTETVALGAARALTKTGWVPVEIVDTTRDGSQPEPPADPEHPPATPAPTEKETVDGA